MKRILTLVCALMALNTALACTNFIITRGASADGSNMISYSADSHQLYGALYKYNATGKYRAGDMIQIHEWEMGIQLFLKDHSSISFPSKKTKPKIF